MEVEIPFDGKSLPGTFAVPVHATGLILFAHGSGSSRLSPRNRFVANFLEKSGLATLLFDLLFEEEEDLRFDIPLLAERLLAATDWAVKQSRLPLGYFGASTGAAAALAAAASKGSSIKAIVSRGGRPDLAVPFLPKVTAPTLLIVGGLDLVVIDLNTEALQHLKCPKKLEIVPGATHLFEEKGKLEIVAKISADWFRAHCRNG